jgi:nitroimidazol reductase NimA-like FMN-containing flavoprotein (pyridoxamine 5'-phosphate oxidase superfamily)
MGKIPFNKIKGSINVQERLRILNNKQRHAVLATDAGGQPYTSLVAFALAPDLKGILFATPKKTTKYRNIMKNRKVSLLIDTRSNSDKGYMRSEAVTILGTAHSVKPGKKWNELTDCLIKKHPQLKEFIRADSTALVMVSFTRVLHTGGFQKVTAWDLKKI